MTMQILKTKSLADVRDGKVAIVLDNELYKIFHDCLDRPELKKARSVTLKISVTPGDGNTLEEATVEFAVSPASLPPTTIIRPMKASKKRNGFAFSDDTDNIDQDEDQRRLAGIDGNEDGE